MKIGVLTSSRADFGIYYPLVNKFWEDPRIEVEIIAFGTHLKEDYGNTYKEIENAGFLVKHKIETSTLNSGPKDISNTIGSAIIKFSEFWSNNKFDIVFALGDRYEMFAAVTAASPFNIDIAHIHAGETTLGAIDNAYRHSISLMSKYLFVSTEEYKQRANEVTQLETKIFNVGALSIDNLIRQEFYSPKEFKKEFNIDIEKPSILSTFHPETVSYKQNEGYIEELISAFRILSNKYQLIITMPNSDTMGDMVRSALVNYQKENKQVKLVESFGMKGYLSCIKYCNMLLGNSSSGFVEAAFFPKWVINLGERQSGRTLTENIISVNIKIDEIIKAVDRAERGNLPEDCNIYGDGNTAHKIHDIILSLYGIK